jgi:hypothetical protein
MSSCVATSLIMPTMPADRSPLKRVRSASLAALNEPLKSALKSCKLESTGSPRDPCEMVQSSDFIAVPSCEGLRNAMAFLHKSRQHAMLLMMQNHWDRAMNVLEKVENATESVSSQRRKLVLEHANLVNNMAGAFSPAPTKRRSVRFTDSVEVATADEMDRTASDVQSPVREEMLVLRASRTIPTQNYSELWV